MKAPDTTIRQWIDGIQHIRLDKVEAMIRKNIAGYESLASMTELDPLVNSYAFQEKIKALEALLEQLEGLE